MTVNNMAYGVRQVPLLLIVLIWAFYGIMGVGY